MAISVANFTVAYTLTPTIPATAAGNTLLVLVPSFSSAGPGSVSSVKLGGVTDNFAQAVPAAHGTNSSVYTDAFAWWDRNCAGGQTPVTVSGSNLNVAGGQGAVFIIEVAGLGTSPTIDKSSSSSTTSGATAWSSGTTGTTTAAAEFWFGAAELANVVVTAPASPWINTEDTYGGVALAGYQVTSATGTATYSGTQSGSAPWASLVGTIKPGGVIVTPPVARSLLTSQAAKRAAFF